MVSKHALISVLVVAGSTLMSACDGDGDNRSFDASGGNQPFGNVDSDTGAPDRISDIWEHGCLADDPDDEETEYTTSVAVFTEESANITHNSYTDSGCTTAANPAEFVASYKLVFPGGTTTTSLGDATHVNVTLESARVDGQAVSDTFSELLGLGETQYDLLLIENNRLYAGDTDGELDGTSEASRPDTLDTRVVYSRQ